MATRAKTTLPDREMRVIAKALADPRRFDILKYIAGQESCMGCGDLLSVFPITPATLSHHLKELETAGLIATDKVGKFLHARFMREKWDAYLGQLQKI